MNDVRSGFLFVELRLSLTSSFWGRSDGLVDSALDFSGPWFGHHCVFASALDLNHDDK